MTKRPQNETNTIGQDGTHAEFQMIEMEGKARRQQRGDAKCIAGKWLSVFVMNGVFCYHWQGGYPTHVVSRETAVSVLRYM